MAVIRDANEEARHRLCLQLGQAGITNEAVLSAFWKTPRHEFIEPALRFRAYEDVTLPIGFQQTLSRPSVVALQLQCALEQVPRPRYVLEIGTGSGFQTALLTHLCLRVYSVERIAGLQLKVEDRMRSLGLRNFRLKHGDGLQGWPEQGPYDVIIAAACASEIPQAWIDQLAPNGVLLSPIVDGINQSMIRIIKSHDGELQRDVVTQASFVPCLPGVI